MTKCFSILSFCELGELRKRVKTLRHNSRLHSALRPGPLQRFVSCSPGNNLAQQVPECRHYSRELIRIDYKAS